MGADPYALLLKEFYAADIPPGLGEGGSSHVGGGSGGGSGGGDGSAPCGQARPPAPVPVVHAALMGGGQQGFGGAASTGSMPLSEHAGEGVEESAGGGASDANKGAVVASASAADAGLPQGQPHQPQRQRRPRLLGLTATPVQLLETLPRGGCGDGGGGGDGGAAAVPSATKPCRLELLMGARVVTVPRCDQSGELTAARGHAILAPLICRQLSARSALDACFVCCCRRTKKGLGRQAGWMEAEGKGKGKARGELGLQWTKAGYHGLKTG
eukprot:365453-Chlamydomonas_euryale.AAC.3